MMPTPRMTILGALAALALVVLPAPSALGQSSPSSLQQALDKAVDLTIDNIPVSEVFRKLSEKTGVKFVIDDQTMACLPYGDQTRLNVRLENVTLRKDLSRVLAPVALQWVIEGDLVRIVPSEPLARMCRRASFEEMQILRKLTSEKVPSVEGSTMIDQLRKATGDKDLELSFQASGDKAAAIARADQALPCTGSDWLDRLCQQGPWTWYLWGDQIIVLDRKAQIARQLQQTVSLRYQNEKLVTILLDLARKGRVTLTMEPGVLNYVPSEVRGNFDLVMADVTIAQALEIISGHTGLEFIRTEAGLKVVPSEKLLSDAGQTAAASRKTPFFVKTTLPGPGGLSIEVYFRPDELPDEMVQQIEAEKANLVKRWMANKTVGATTAPAPSVAPAAPAPAPAPAPRDANR
jgi:hypothetical protein